MTKGKRVTIKDRINHYYRRLVITIMVAHFSITVVLPIMLSIMWRKTKRKISKLFRKKTQRISLELTPPDKPPAILGLYGEEKHAHIQNVNLSYIENGDKSKPLILFVHGFPDFWFSWRNQIEHYAKNYHVVAVDLRGCGHSEKFFDKSCFTLELLVEDLKNLISYLGKEEAIIIAHDIGALILYSFLLQYPTFVKKYIAISAAPPYAFNLTLQQVLASWYVYFFQLPSLPEEYLQANDVELGIFDEIYVDQSVDVINSYKFIFGKPGAMIDPVNYFRANAITIIQYMVFAGKDYEMTEFPDGLVIYGQKDQKMLPDSYKNAKKVPRLQIKQIQNAGHYPHQQSSKEVNDTIDFFLSGDYDDISYPSAGILLPKTVK